MEKIFADGLIFNERKRPNATVYKKADYQLKFLNL